MKRSSRRTSHPRISDEERRRRNEAFWRGEFLKGVAMLERLGKMLGRDFETHIQFPEPYPPVSDLPGFDPLFDLARAAAADGPTWDGPFAWKCGRSPGHAGCRLLIRARGGGPVIAAACRRRYLRGDPPVDVDYCAEEMRTGARDEDYYPVDGTSPCPRPVPEPPPPPVQEKLEFCVADVTHSAQPLLVSEDFTDDEKRKALRRLAGDVRRVARGIGQPVPPAHYKINDPLDRLYDDLPSVETLLASLWANQEPGRVEVTNMKEKVTMEEKVPQWQSRSVVPITEARHLREAQVTRRSERLSVLSEAATAVADLLVARAPALETQSQLHLDFCTLEVRRSGNGGTVTLTFRLIDPPRQDLDPSSCTNSEWDEILSRYQSWAETEGHDAVHLAEISIGAECPRMAVLADGHPGVVDDINPMTFQNSYMTAEEFLDDFLTAVMRLVENAVSDGETAIQAER